MRHDVEELQTVMRPVAALADEYPPGYVSPPHSHIRAQLLYASAGVMSVVTPQGGFVVPPQRALWVPAGVRHELRCRGAVSLRTLYVDPQSSPRLPRECRILEVSYLLRALMLASVEVPVEYDLGGRDGRIMLLLLDEIAVMPTVALSAPMPSNERVARACRAIFNEPSRERPLKELARMAGMSMRTFTRKFRTETGLSVADWRQHVRLLEALSLLSIGHSVTQVALEVGYQTPSAFTAMFRRVFGTTPSHYFRSSAHGAGPADDSHESP